jgi:hypothetical protein
MNKGKQKLTTLYEACKSVKIGSIIKCPSCNTQHTKNAYNTIFCKTKGGSVCKDNYWNNVDPNKRNNKKRISPANARYYNNVILPNEAAKRGYPNVYEMLNAVDDTDSMSCYVEPCSCCGLKYEYCRCDLD